MTKKQAAIFKIGVLCCSKACSQWLQAVQNCMLSEVRSESGDSETAQSDCGKRRLHKAGGDAVIHLEPVSLHGVPMGTGNALSAASGGFFSSTKTVYFSCPCSSETDLKPPLYRHDGRS